MNGASGDEWAIMSNPPISKRISKNGTSQSFLFFFRKVKNSLIKDIDTPNIDFQTIQACRNFWPVASNAKLIVDASVRECHAQINGEQSPAVKSK